MKCIGKICNNAVFSSSVTLAGGTVIINIPQQTFKNGQRLCLFVTQTIPQAAPQNAPVVITIGTSTTQYPLVNNCCAQVNPCGIRSRRIYPLQVVTTASGANFKILRRTCCSPQNVLPSIPAPTVATTEGGETT